MCVRVQYTSACDPTKMSQGEDREAKVNRARLAEQAERYEDMAKVSVITALTHTCKLSMETTFHFQEMSYYAVCMSNYTHVISPPCDFLLVQEVSFQGIASGFTCST